MGRWVGPTEVLGILRGDGPGSRGPQEKDLATNIFCSKREPSRIINELSRAPLVSNEFIFNMMQQGIHEYFRGEFANFMDMFPSINQLGEG